jgi:hypothetical protein
MEFRDIATDGTTWVAVGTNGKIYTTTDPTSSSWTDRTFDTSAHYFRVRVSDGVWYLTATHIVDDLEELAETGRVYTTTDPTGTWTEVPGTEGDIDCIAIVDGKAVAFVNFGLEWFLNWGGIYARPISDVATTGWSSTPLWSKVDDDPDDPDGTVVSASV